VGNVIRSLDQRGIGMAILSEDSRIENCNGSMDELLREGSALRMEQGRLTSGASVCPPELSSLVHRTRKSGATGRLSYEDSAGKRRGSIVAYPVPTAFDWEGVSENKVILVVTDSSRTKGSLPEKLRKNYGLTRAESRVAGMLLDGKTSNCIAAELAVQANSVRAHLKAIFSKTGTHSQVELLSFLQQESDTL